MFPALLFAQISAGAAPKPVTELPPLVADAQAISPDHKRLAISTRDEGVWVLDIATRTVASRVPRTNSVVEYVTWTSDSSKLGLLHRNADVEIVDATTGRLTAATNTAGTSHADWEKREIHFAAGDTLLIAVLGGPHTGVFDGGSGKRIAEVYSGSTITAFALSRDGECLALGTDSGIVQLWNPRTGERLEGEVTVRQDQRVHPEAWKNYRGIHSLAFDPSGHLLAIGGGDCEAYLWCRTQQRVVRTFSHCAVEVFSTQGIGSVAFNADGSRLLTTSLPYWEVRVWDLPSDYLLDYFEIDDGPRPLTAWFSSDGTRVVHAARLGCATIDPRRGSPRNHMPFHSVGGHLPVPGRDALWWQHDGDFAWAVVDHEFIVRKIPEEEPVLRIKVREK